MVGVAYGIVYSNGNNGVDNYKCRGSKMKKFNYYNAVSSASILLTMLVISAEFIKPLKDFLASVFFHHWIGKAVLMVLVFFIFGLIFRRDIEKEADKKIAWYSVIVSLSIIFLFFVVLFFVD